jgi:hypothetical protein
VCKRDIIHLTPRPARHWERRWGPEEGPQGYSTPWLLPPPWAQSGGRSTDLEGKGKEVWECADSAGKAVVFGFFFFWFFFFPNILYL